MVFRRYFRKLVILVFLVRLVLEAWLGRSSVVFGLGKGRMEEK